MTKSKAKGQRKNFLRTLALAYFGQQQLTVALFALFVLLVVQFLLLFLMCQANAVEEQQKAKART